MDARPARLYTAACGLLGDRWVARPQVTVDDDGIIVATADGDEPPRTRAGVTVIDLGDAALAHLDPTDDIHASAAYRAQLVRVLTARVVRSARAASAEGAA